MQFHKDVECVSDCIDILLNAPLGEHQIQFHRDMGCILACNYLLLKEPPLGRESNTVPQG